MPLNIRAVIVGANRSAAVPRRDNATATRKQSIAYCDDGDVVYQKSFISEDDLVPTPSMLPPKPKGKGKTKRQGASAVIPGRACSTCGDVSEVAQCTAPGCELGLCVLAGLNSDAACVVLPPGVLLDAFRTTFKCPQHCGPERGYTLTASGMNFLHVRPMNAATAMIVLWYEAPFFRDTMVSFARYSLGQDVDNLLVAASRLTLPLGSRDATEDRMDPFIAELRRKGKRTPIAVFVDTHATPEGKVVFQTPLPVLKALGFDVKALPHVESSAFTLSRLLETFIGDCFFAFPKAPSLKGLFLIACGPAQTEPAALRDIQDLVKRQFFTFVLGFDAYGLIGETVCLPVQEVYLELVIKQRARPSLWDAFVDAYSRTAKDTPTNAVFTFRSGDSVESRVLMYNHVKKRAWGLLVKCPHRCTDEFVEAEKRRQGGTYRLRCNHCHRRPYVAQPDWVKPTAVRDWFWAPFPLPDPEWPHTEDCVRGGNVDSI
ncbi:hypothetical protein C8T65DRAFT_704012 [Cerioporus squamosus]|nr:hypothetical protein C8T65DRAFT_704012 [Cerioporus squamosus]